MMACCPHCCLHHPHHPATTTESHNDQADPGTFGKKTHHLPCSNRFFGSSMIIYDHLNPFRLLIYCCPGFKPSRKCRESIPTHHPGTDASCGVPRWGRTAVVSHQRCSAPSPGASFEQPKKDWLNGVQYVCPFFVISNGWEIWPCLKRSNLGDVSQIRLPDGPKSKSSNLDGDDPLIINRWS